ncbi:ParB/RepB/Spo0J family partition protein [uncultured Hyphomicrobium sp.]|uniref:ParB/RepB/Spo0J family partition protein n=1 Tax=uncultured Hyphomicrobium sp. TaxID=194373 RepID=UPI0025DEAD6D|nr:ParB/RepB/Spo0J family partition protein [uncultured Hyphomicrobium sp.]
MNSPLPKSRLGRGLASLIGEAPQNQPRLPAEGEQRLLPVAQLRSGRFNPRKDFAEQDLAELAESIRTKGLVQPIIVRPHPEDAQAFEIVAGERRWRASQKAGMHMVPVIIRELGDREVLELAIIENVQRADLNAIEEANGYRELIERFDYSQEQVSEIIGKSRSHVANTLRLLKLPEAVQAYVQDGRLTAGHARTLVGREDAETLAQRILEQNLNVREAEALAQSGSGAGPIGIAGATGGARKLREKDPDTKAFEKELADTLGLKVEVKRGSGESGNLIIKYGNFDQLDYIRLRLTGSSGG